MMSSEDLDFPSHPKGCRVLSGLQWDRVSLMVERKTVNYLITKLLPVLPTVSVMKSHPLLISPSPVEHARSDEVTACSDSLVTWKKGFIQVATFINYTT